MAASRYLQRRASGVELWAIYSRQAPTPSFLVRGPVDAGSDAIFSVQAAADAEFKRRLAALLPTRDHWYGRARSHH